MNAAPNPEQQRELLSQITAFVSKASGLRMEHTSQDSALITQTMDGKGLAVDISNLEAVLFRSDTEGQEFIQVNFCTGKKILLTSNLIGFKPIAHRGLDLAKLPRVVTTPDVHSVFDAIQDALHAADAEPHEIVVLKRVFEAVIAGGESVGFDLSKERAWLARLPSHLSKTSA